MTGSNTGIIALAFALSALPGAWSQDAVNVTSPGLTASQLDAQGRLVEDWGAFAIELVGEDMPARGDVEVAALVLDDVVPGARASWRRGPVQVQLTVFRGPAWPAGVDVVQVRLEERGGEAFASTLRLRLPDGVRLGERTVGLGSRTIVTLPAAARLEREPRAWGHRDEAGALPGWSKPKSGFDPAFANIRAGMGGVPIFYRFAIEPGARADVVLGFCESYWSGPGSRTMSCKVEGSPLEKVDPLARWGRHQPGGVLFAGRDENRDGSLDVLVLPAPGSSDRNPILNALWVFPTGREIDPAQVVTGRLNILADRYVDVGGEQDQSLYPAGNADFPIRLEAHGATELTFLVACRGGSAPVPDKTAWTAERLRAAAVEVWESWPKR